MPLIINYQSIDFQQFGSKKLDCTGYMENITAKAIKNGW